MADAPPRDVAGSGPTRSLRARRLVLGALLLAVLGAAACAGWLAWTGLQARDALLTAQPVVSRVQQQVLDGDADGARASLSDLRAATEQARSSTHDPVWAAAELLPAVGDDIRVVRQLTRLVDDVAQRALPPLVEAAGSLDPAALSPVDGAVDLAPLQAAAPLLREADDALQAAVAAGAAVNTGGVDRRIAGPADELRAQLDEGARTTATGARAAALLPGMLGAERPRTYLVLFQNNAEVRATGGIPGAMAVVRADGGRVAIESQASSSDVPRFEEPVLPLSQEFVALHSQRPGVFVQDVTATPHFPTSASLAREMWRRVSGQEVDGVLSVDPVAMSYLLNATGPLPLAGGLQITPDDAVELLLSRVYAEVESPALQDVFFAAAATSVFTGLTSGDADPGVLLDQLARAAGERRLLVWSADPAEQQLVAGTVLEGALPTGRDGRPAVGVYLNDGTAAKMSYYLRHEVSVRQVCDAALPTYTVQVRLRSEAPPDAASSLPRYVLGGPAAGDLARGSVRTVVAVYGPAGGGIVQMRRDGGPAPFAPQAEQGWPVGALVVDLAPGEDAVVEADVVVLGGATSPPVVRTTPGPVPMNLPASVTDCGKD